MGIDMKYLPIVISAIPATGVCGYLFWKMKLWMRLMDNFKEGLPFEKALEALKQGKSIRRKKSYFGLTKMLISVRGKETEKFCKFDLNRRGTLEEDAILRINDIMSNDWIVED